MKISIIQMKFHHQVSSGIWKKKIIFPKKLVSLDPEQVKYIIRHENYHNLFQDNLIKMISVLFLCIYWFHPCVWLLLYILYIDIEVVCDEAVIKDLNHEQRSAYAKAIIKCASVSTPTLDVWFTAFSKNKVEDRIKKIMVRKKSPFISVLSIGIICILSVIFATSPVANEGINQNYGVSHDTKSSNDSKVNGEMEIPIP